MDHGKIGYEKMRIKKLQKIQNCTFNIRIQSSSLQLTIKIGFQFNIGKIYMLRFCFPNDREGSNSSSHENT
jgi:hypothetical protein